MAEGGEMERSAGPTERESIKEVTLEVFGTFPQLKALMTTTEGGTSTGTIARAEKSARGWQDPA